MFERYSRAGGSSMNPATSSYWLIVEDDDADFFLLRRACERTIPRPPRIHREADGEQAERFLAAAPQKPQLIIADLKMPRCTGLELLDWLKGEAELRKIPFVLLTGSDSPKDMVRAQEGGADAYIEKPGDPAHFSEVIHRLIAMQLGRDGRDTVRTPVPN